MSKKSKKAQKAQRKFLKNCLEEIEAGSIQAVERQSNSTWYSVNGIRVYVPTTDRTLTVHYQIVEKAEE